MGLYAHGDGVIELPFLDFAPDLAYDASTKGQMVLIDMDNAMPSMKGYQAMNGIAPYNGVGPAPEAVYGSTIGYFTSGVAKVYFGGPTHIWRLDGSTWTQVSPAFTTPGPPWRWRFAQFGDDIIAVNGDSSIGPLVATGDTGTFTPLGGSPPFFAWSVVSVNGQVLMFEGANWYASALGTDNDWVPDIQTQAGQGVLYDAPGNIVASAAIFRNVVVFKETATWLGSYVGGYPVWNWQLISDLTGTWCQESVITLPDSVAFLGKDDFYVTSGYTPQRIPNSHKEWFFDVADPNQFNVMLSRYDALHGVAYWYFVSRQPVTPGVPDRLVAWNPRTGRWASGYVGQGGAFNVPTPNQYPGILTGLYFDAHQVLQSWTAAPGTMRLETSYLGTPNSLSQCMRAKPIFYVEPTSATLTPYHVRNLGDPDINTTLGFLNQSDGWYYFRQYDRWHRFEIITLGPNVLPTTVAMTGAEISSIAVEMRQGGWR